MRRDVILAAAAAVVLAFAVFFIKADGAGDGLRFRLGLSDREAEIKAVKEGVALFNIYYARLFTSAGDMEGLNLFPADNLIKRRVIQEIASWKEQGSALVYDRHGIDIQSVDLLGPERAVAVAEEHWALVLRDLATGRKSRGSKTLRCRCRYLLGKIEQEWKVLEYDVFGMHDLLPPVPEAWKR
jgi:hypothetical protein